MTTVLTPTDRAALNRELARALARALAYAAFGKAEAADKAARTLIQMLRVAGVLADGK